MRCFERYGERINRHDIREIVGMIRSGDIKQATRIEKQSLRVSVWVVVFRSKEMKVVYDSKRATIVSFLPMNDKEDDICTLA